MDERPIKLFFSWQSDLPKADTKSLIIEVLDEIAKDEYILSDRDTKGEAGSPSIDDVIFRKIDECDVFVADISIINQKFVNKQKEDVEKSKVISADPVSKDDRPVERPVMNPNVMLELGYAVSTKGWGNICLLYNTEYGEENSLPFDIRQHRHAVYSTKIKEGLSKKKIRDKARKDIKEAILQQIEDTRSLPQRAKRGFSFFVVGGFSGNQVENTVAEYIIRDNPIIDKHIEVCCKEAARIIEQIENIKIIRQEDQLINSLRAYDTLQDKIKRYTVSDAAKEEIKKFAKEYLKTKISDEFFNLGGQLKNEFMHQLGADTFQGTDEEKEKHKLLNDLIVQIKLIQLINELVDLFDEVSLIPLAIHNASHISDALVKVNVHVENAFVFDENVLPEFIRKNGGYIFDKGYIADLFHQKQMSNITYDRDITVNDSDRMRALRDAHPFSKAEHTCADMLQELQKYIASPIHGTDDYRFEINNLLANEVKWLGPMIAVKKTKGQTVLKYDIRSEKSDGTVSGVCLMGGTE